MNLKIGKKRSGFYQWDTGQYLIVEDADECNEVHFCRRGDATSLTCRIREEDGMRIADVPNILLQKGDCITAYLYSTGEDGSRTRYGKGFYVHPRPRPENYIYTQTETLNYASLDKRLTNLETTGGTVKTVNGAEPDANGNVQVTAESGATSWNDLPDRPFGDITEYIMKPCQITSVYEAMGEYYYCNLDIAPGILIAGETYVVSFDGTDYISEAFEGPNGYVCLGNMGVSSWRDKYENTGEPFAAMVHQIDPWNDIYTAEEGTYSVSIAKGTGSVQQLDEKYIPDTIARVEDIPKSVGGINYDLNVKAVNHRGFSTEAPENTIPAYILSKKKGFTYVECDVSFTKDGVAVLLHDGTIDRTSDGSGNISDLNYVDVYQYDFGSWKSEAYAGTKIPTFKEFIILCRNLGLHPYIELKSSGAYTREQICSLVDIVEACGMKGKVTWISFSATFLAYIRDYDKTARLGYVCSLSSTTINTARNLRTGENDVFLDCSYSTVTDVSECVDADIPVEVWTVNSASAIKNLNPYVSGVTSDNLVAGKILHDASMTYVAPEPDLSAISISLSATGLSFTSKEDQSITATVLPVGCTDPVVWTSSNESVVTVSSGMSALDGIVTPVRSGTATIRATAGSVAVECTVTVDVDDRTLLYNWDFTNSMTDTVSGLTPTLQNNATQDTKGLSIPAANSYANFGAIAKRGMTFELDITADSNLNTGTAHGRLLCFSQYNSSLDDGVLWRGSTYNYWGTYLSASKWGAALTEDKDVFNGKTMTVVIDLDGHVTVYAGNELLVKTDDVVDFESGGYVTVGSSSISAVGMTITAMRIYDGETYIPQTKPNDWVDDVIVLTADDFIAKGIAFSSETGADYPYVMSRTDRISFVGYNVTLDSGYEYTVTCESATGAIGKLAVRQVPSWYDVKAKVHLSASHDSGWKDNGYKFSQQNSYECAWITLAAANTTDAVSLTDLTSVTLTRSKT